MTNPNCEICGKPATSWILRDPFGKSDATRPACADHAPQFHNPADVIEIEQLRGNLRLAEEGLANYALEVRQLKAHEHAAATILATALACNDYQPQHMEWMAEAARWLNEPRASHEPEVGVLPGQVIAYQNGKIEGLQAKLAEIHKWADAWSKPPHSDASESDKGWYWAAQEVQNLLDPNPQGASRDASPADLVGALQDVVHTDPGPVRAGHAVKSGESQ